jgi:hypothetical protein
LLAVRFEIFRANEPQQGFTRLLRKGHVFDTPGFKLCLQVQIESSRPISKNKAWVVTEILKKERVFDTSEYAAERAAANAISLPLAPKPVVVSVLPPRCEMLPQRPGATNSVVNGSFV